MDPVVPTIEPQTTPTAPIPEPAPVTPVAEPQKEAAGTGSLAEHTAQVSREADGRFKSGRTRAKSQQAGPEDVATIAEYTKRLRTAEDAIGLKVEQKPGESDRVFQLRRRAEYAEAIAKRNADKEPPAPKPLGPKVKPVPQVEPGQFTEAEPKLEDFSDKDDPYAAWIRATNAYDRKKEAFEAAEAQKKQAVESTVSENHAQIKAWFDERQQDFGGRLKALMEAQPESVAIFEAAKQIPLTDAMHAALLLDDKGEQVMLDVAKYRDALAEQLDELYLLTDGKQVTPSFVALVQRRFHRMTQAVSTGAAASMPVLTKPAPRPPTPVRTVPTKPADTPPKDEDSLAAHISFYGKKR